jgi:signal peptidase I
MKANTLSNKEVSTLRQAAEELHNQEAEYRRVMNWDFLIYLLSVLLVAFSIRAFIAEPIVVDGESMFPTLLDHEYMLVEKLSYYVERPERGDIVVCYYPGFTISCVKRVIGLPGDEIYVWDGEVYINGEPLDESEYWNDYVRGNMSPQVVPENTVFVMGDNRNVSGDSREESVGPIPYEKVVGKTVAVLWPIDEIRSIDHINYSH